MKRDFFGTLKTSEIGAQSAKFYSLPRLEAHGVGAISQLPISIRILLESVLRNCDGKRITEENVHRLASWQPNAERTEELPFVVSRVLLQDFTGVPLVVDLAAMRSVVARMGRDPNIVEPMVPVDLIIDHSVQVDFSTTSDAFTRNIAMEFKRNHSRYKFLKWGRQAFDGFNVMPPGLGICHQVNLEYLAQCVIHKDGTCYPDTLVGTDSHTTMINGLGVAPGSRVVTEYLQKTGLMPYIAELGFHLAGYGCTTCIGNSGPIDPCIEQAIRKHDLIGASVLSGNRNFEARVHQSIRANFLMSPPLVVAFALAGTVAIDVQNEPLGKDKHGRDIFLRELWPSVAEIAALMHSAFEPEIYQRLYAKITGESPMWDEIEEVTGKTYKWNPATTYILEPPYFEKFSLEPEKFDDICGARPLAIFGDSVTTDHISPAGAIKADSPAGKYLQEHEISIEDFNSYGARRGNHQVMVRGTFANVRIKNLMVPGTEGGFTLHQPAGEQMTIYDAAVKYRASGVPLLVIAGKEYGVGSSRDWAAKGTMLLGVRAVIAESFERIHRSNLIGMGVLPCRFKEGVNARSLNLDGTETFDIIGLKDGMEPREDLMLVVHRQNGESIDLPLTLRIETPVEVEYYRHGGILPYVLRQLLKDFSVAQRNSRVGET